VVAGVNDEDVYKHDGIIANPNCSTAQLMPVLKALDRAFGLKVGAIKLERTNKFRMHNYLSNKNIPPTKLYFSKLFDFLLNSKY
jgi:hypothetical protein